MKICKECKERDAAYHDSTLYCEDCFAKLAQFWLWRGLAINCVAVGARRGAATGWQMDNEQPEPKEKVKPRGVNTTAFTPRSRKRSKHDLQDWGN